MQATVLCDVKLAKTKFSAFLLYKTFQSVSDVRIVKAVWFGSND